MLQLLIVYLILGRRVKDIVIIYLRYDHLYANTSAVLLIEHYDYILNYILNTDIVNAAQRRTVKDVDLNAQFIPPTSAWVMKLAYILCISIGGAVWWRRTRLFTRTHRNQRRN